MDNRRLPDVNLKTYTMSPVSIYEHSRFLEEQRSARKEFHVLNNADSKSNIIRITIQATD